MSGAREQWLVAGQALLRRDGAAAVKLQALTAELGRTSGSFYHHFAGMPPFLDELARYYGTDQPTAYVARADDPDPITRLGNLYAVSRDAVMAPLDAAMRDWAGSNAVAAQAVRDADAILLRFVERAFRDLGFDRDDARARAQLMVSAGVARISPPWRVTAATADRMIAALTGR